jgi:hypothetical protein
MIVGYYFLDRFIEFAQVFAQFFDVVVECCGL